MKTTYSPQGGNHILLLALSLSGSWLCQAEETLFSNDRLSLTASLNAQSTVIVQGHSWFGQPERTIGVGTSTWAELSIEPELDLTIKDVMGGELYFGLSTVGSKNYNESADGLSADYSDPGKFTWEQAHVGWKRDFGKNSNIDVKAGYFDYKIGSGFLIQDGGNDGGNRGGFYLGSRSAFENSALISLKLDDLLIEAFTLENNPRRAGVNGRVVGGNLEYTLMDKLTLGGTYIAVVDISHGDHSAQKLRTYDFRADYSITDKLTLSGEYALQGGGKYKGYGWFAEVKYDFSDVLFKPTLAYRYNFTSGDNPKSWKDESFQPLAYGYDAYQGELAGNWIFGAQNIASHSVMGKANITDSVTLSAAFIHFERDRGGAYGNEVDVGAGWQINKNLYVSASIALLVPQDQAVVETGGSATWVHGIFYASLTF